MAVTDLNRCPKSEADDWHNVSDPTTRRKLQNRQNQRARRLRNINRGNEPLVKQYVPGRKKGQFVYLPGSDKKGKQDEDPRSKSDRGQSVFLVSSSKDCDTADLSQKLATEDDRLIRSALNAIGPSLLTFASMGGVSVQKCRATDYWERGWHLHSDRLLTLLYYNLFRAFSWNVDILGLDFSQMTKEDYPSPFLLTLGSDGPTTRKLPRCLQPTEIQKNVYHHAGYDIFPCPIIRNNMIQYMGSLSEAEEDEFCLDMEGFNRSSCGVGTDPGPYSNLEEGDRSGVTIWGDPWDLKSWEISEYIVLKHPWLVAGAIEAQIYTNARRRARGWKELHFA